jgi:hypothetical protein
MTQAPVQVEAVESHLPSADLWGAFKCLAVEGSRLELAGWALGTASDVERIEVLTEGSVVASTVPSLPRQELAEQIPDRPSAARCGFKLVIEAKGKGNSVLELRAVLEDGTAIGMGTINAVAPVRRWDVFRRR